jgi:hypothetical protein
VIRYISLTCAVASWQATRYEEGNVNKKGVQGKGVAYVRPELEIARSSLNVLAVRVVKMSIENLLR